MKKKHYLLKINVSDEVSIWENKIEKIGIGSFDLTNDGFYFGRSNNYYLTSEEIYQLDILSINQTVDLQDKKIYRHPHLELPRQKVDLLKNKFNVKIIRDLNVADIQIISDKLIQNLISLDWNQSLSYVEMFAVFTALKENNHLTESGLDKCKEILATVEKDAYIDISVVKNYNYHSPVNDTIKDKTDSFEAEGRKSRILKGADNIKKYEELINSSAVVIRDIEINKIICEDLVVLAEDQFEQIQKMIISTDIQNKTLALEMLSNSNVEESFDIVSYIFYWHYDHLKMADNWNNINVKTLRKRFEKFSGSKQTHQQYSYDNYITYLDAENKTTEFIVNKTINLLYDNVVKKTMGCKNKVFAIDIKSIYLVDKFKNKIIKKEECIEI